MTALLVDHSAAPAAPAGRRAAPRLLRPAMLAALTIGLGLAGLASRSLWIDEAVTVSVAGFSSGELADTWTVNGGNMALYYVLAHGWLQLGHAEWLLRLPSVAFAAGAVVVTYLLARRLFGPRIATVAGLLLATSASLLLHAQEGRSYALLVMLVTSGWLLLDQLVERETPGRWVAYVAVAVATVWAHIFGAVFVVTQLASLALLPRGALRPRAVARASAALAIAVLPLAVVALRPEATDPGWIPPLSAGQVADVATAWAGGVAWPLVFAHAALWVIGAALLVRGLRGTRRSAATWRRALPVVWLVGPLLLGVLVSATAKPLLVPRYLSPALPAAALLVAVALCRLRRPALLAAAALVVAGSVPALADHYREPKDDWIAATRYVLAAGGASDAIALYGGTRVAMEYYWDRMGRPAAAPAPVFPTDDPWDRPQRLYRRPSTPPAEAVAAHDRVWLVHRAGRHSEPAIEEVLRRGYRLVASREFAGPILVELFERVGPAG